MRFVDMIDALPGKIRKMRCMHHYVKHYDPQRKGYVRRCSICGKVKEYGAVKNV